MALLPEIRLSGCTAGRLKQTEMQKSTRKDKEPFLPQENRAELRKIFLSETAKHRYNHIIKGTTQISDKESQQTTVRNAAKGNQTSF